MEKYKSYKDSGIEWLGEIPEHWEIRRIKDIATVKTGSKNTEDKVSEGNYPFFVRSQNVERINSYSFDGEAILTAGDGVGVGKVFHYYKGKFETHQRVYRISHFNKHDGRFLFNYLKRNLAKEVLKFNVKSTVDSLRMPMFLNFNVAFPPLKEQTQIANYLDAKTILIDKKIKLLKQKIKHYKAYRKTLINETVTKGLAKSVKLKNSGIDWIGEIPEHWEVKRYKSFGRTIKGKNMKMSDIEFDNSLPLLSLEYLRNDSVQHPIFCYSNDKSLKSTEDDLIIVWDGAAVGEILKSKVGYVSSTIAKLDINKKKFNTKYFYHLRGAIDYKLKQIPTGMGIPHLNPTLFKNFKCPSPPIKEQQQIADFLDAKTTTIDNIVNNIETQITTLKELRKTLINEVVSGKVKVTA